MSRKIFGQIVTALRKELADEHDHKLTQAQLAEKAQRHNPQTWLNETLIGKIERGERAKLDEQAMLDLADALELTLGERREFALLANGLSDSMLYKPQAEADFILNHLLEQARLIQLPVFIVDTYLDVIAVNASLLTLYHGTLQDLSPTSRHSFNMLKFIFSPAFELQRNMMGAANWTDFAYNNILYFRRQTLPYRTTPYFIQLLSELRQMPLFRHNWQRVTFDKKAHFVGASAIQINSPQWGSLHYFAASTTTLTPCGPLDFIIYVPASAETAHAFQRISQELPAQVYRLASWPHKSS